VSQLHECQISHALIGAVHSGDTLNMRHKGDAHKEADGKFIFCGRGRL
jgi:hypothetical protein